uniref:Uncharacterized protein n=1 Tax=Klebsiella pneumoniae TaxID=573 RepID=A0A8B0SY55_KLEPN|nr:hypothetical protein [Klebsiella pneumoniae]
MFFTGQRASFYVTDNEIAFKGEVAPGPDYKNLSDEKNRR